MKKIAAISLFMLIFTGYSSAFDDGDFQYWNTESVSLKVDEDWKISLEEEMRLGDNAGNLYYNHLDLGLTYSGLVDWLDLGLNYRYISEKSNGEWKYENVPHLNTTLKWKLLDFGFSNRARMEYKDKEGAEDYWRYRNQLTVKMPLKITKFEIQPYIADEIFYDFNAETLNRNRLYAGLNLKLFKNLKTDIYYLWQSSEKNDDWSDTHASGTKFQMAF